SMYPPTAFCSASRVGPLRPTHASRSISPSGRMVTIVPLILSPRSGWSVGTRPGPAPPIAAHHLSLRPVGARPGQTCGLGSNTERWKGVQLRSRSAGKSSFGPPKWAQLDLCAILNHDLRVVVAKVAAPRPAAFVLAGPVVNGRDS